MKKKWICLLTALTLLIGVCAAAPLTSGAVVLETDKSCSMTIFPESPNKPANQPKFWPDMQNADIVVDIYKVADAVRQPGYDMYSYKFIGNYDRLSIPSSWDDITASYWQKLAQDAGEIALSEGKPEKSGIDIMSDDNNGSEVIEGLKPGLYLIIPRGSKMDTVEEYKITMKSPDENINDNIATIANSEIYTYIFSPEIISVPMRGVLEGENEALDVSVSSNNPQMSSDDQGNWIYDVNVYLKPVRIRRYGALKIVKELENYESEDEVQSETNVDAGQDEKTTFVFKAEWTWTDPMDPAEEPVSKTETRVDSLTFDGSSKSSQEVTIDRIPISNTGKTVVTVSEIYEGASYELAGKVPDKPIELEAKQIKNGIAIVDENGVIEAIVSDSDENVAGIQTITFTNRYNRLQRKGYGIKNEFKYEGKDDDGVDVWEWYQDGDFKGTEKYDGTFIKKEEPVVTPPEGPPLEGTEQ